MTDFLFQFADETTLAQGWVDC